MEQWLSSSMSPYALTLIQGQICSLLFLKLVYKSRKTGAKEVLLIIKQIYLYLWLYFSIDCLKYYLITTYNKIIQMLYIYNQEITNQWELQMDSLIMKEKGKAFNNSTNNYSCLLCGYSL